MFCFYYYHTEDCFEVEVRQHIMKRCWFSVFLSLQNKTEKTEKTENINVLTAEDTLVVVHTNTE